MEQLSEWHTTSKGRAENQNHMSLTPECAILITLLRGIVYRALTYLKEDKFQTYDNDKSLTEGMHM